ncbi:hypothetical protein PINS_up010982 [Pythium insidiosum]|nr:hypothetical protein PINS_up010982 [Pythium insidiosum]
MAETMKQITTNSPGLGDMTLFRATRALVDDAASSTVGHDVVITTGDDGVVYFVDLTTETQLMDPVVWDGATPAVAVVPEQTHVLLVSGDENALYSYTMPPKFEMDALLFRSPVAIRHIACTSRLIAIATEDPEIKVLRRSATDQIIAVSGHEHGVKSVSFDPHDGRFLCSASEDGTVRVFEIDEDALSATQRASFKIQFADLGSEDVLCRCAWQPHGDLLAFPVNQSIVELVDRKTWSSRGQLMLPIGKSQSSDINLLSFSPNGQYLLAATLKKELFIWAVNSKDVVRSFRVEHNVLSIAWSPNDNIFTAYNDGGRVGFVKDAIPQGLTPPHHVSGALPVLSNAPTAAATKTSKISKSNSGVGQFIEDEAEVDGDADNADEDDEAELRVEAIKARYGFGSSSTAATASADLGLADDTIDDEDDGDAHARRDVGGVGGGSPFRTLQEPFQPGSVTDSHGVCLLAWTPLGEIECLRGASRSENLVKVEFADKSRRGFKFSDNYRFSLAALDDHGACFAVPRRVREDWDDDLGAADQEHGDIVSSYVFYRPFDTWASNSSWHIDLPDGEDAECVATAREFCAVATSLLCLRVFTTSGIPFALVRLPGRVVTMAAQGRSTRGRVQRRLWSTRISAAGGPRDTRRRARACAGAGTFADDTATRGSLCEPQGKRGAASRCETVDNAQVARL